MSILKKIKQVVFDEFVELIEWIVHTPETIIWRFSLAHSNIKNGAQLIVRKEQVAVLVNKGQIADVYEPGHYELTSVNMPILSTLKGWNYGFNSPFKVDIYFVNTKEFLNFKWDTEKPIMVCIPEFGAIRLRAFGTYSFQVQNDPIVFIRKVAGTDGHFTTDSITEQLRKFVISKFTNYLTESSIAAIELASNLDELSNEATIALKKDFADYGIELKKFVVEKVSLPEAVEVALDEQTSKRVVGKIATYSQMHFTDSLKDAVSN